MARRRRKGKAGKWVGRAADGAAGGPGTLSARRADRLAGAGQPRLDRARAGHDGLHRRQRHPRRHHHAGRARKGSTGGRCSRRATSPPPTRTRAGSRSDRASSASISTRRRWRDITPRTIWSALAGGKRVMHVEYVPSPYYAARADPASARGISPAVGGDPRRLRARRAAAGRSGSTIRATARATLSTGHRQGQRGPDLQRCGRALAEARRGEGQPVAAVRQRPGLALPANAAEAICLLAVSWRAAWSTLLELGLGHARSRGPCRSWRSSRPGSAPCTLPVLTTAPLRTDRFDLPDRRRLSGRRPATPFLTSAAVGRASVRRWRRSLVVVGRGRARAPGRLLRPVAGSVADRPSCLGRRGRASGSALSGRAAGPRSVVLLVVVVCVAVGVCWHGGACLLSGLRSAPRRRRTARVPHREYLQLELHDDLHPTAVCRTQRYARRQGASPSARRGRRRLTKFRARSG